MSTDNQLHHLASDAVTGPKPTEVVPDRAAPKPKKLKVHDHDSVLANDCWVDLTERFVSDSSQCTKPPDPFVVGASGFRFGEHVKLGIDEELG